MFRQLWHFRDRLPVGGFPWCKTWAKRLQQLPMLLKQAWFHGRFSRAGADIHPITFFSEPRLVTGDLKRLTVGQGSFIGRAELSVHAPMSIGCNVGINDGARILTASHDVSDPHWRTVAAAVTISDHAWIAVDAIILPGVRIGRGAVVGAGAVVAKDVPDGAIVVGNPARLLKKRRTDFLDYSPVQHLALFTAWRALPSEVR